jgi:4-amino-4-deoxy-L-arabinose transferase-like glycosyltransferase
LVDQSSHTPQFGLLAQPADRPKVAAGQGLCLGRTQVVVSGAEACRYPGKYKPGHRLGSSPATDVRSSGTREINCDGALARAIVCLVLLTVVMRLPGITRPLVGQFATKNVVYAMIARNWATGRAPFWLPTIDCLAGGERGWHLLEIPVAAYLAGAGWAVCGGSLDIWGRAISIAFSAGSVALLFLLVHNWHGIRAAWVGSLVLALSPGSVIFGQSFMLESSAVFFMLLTLWSTEHWLEREQWWWAGLTALSLALLLCTKIYLSVMLLPLVVLVARKVKAEGASGRWRWITGALAVGLIGAAPALLWCDMVMRVASPDNPLSAHVYYSFCRSTAVHEIPN